MNGARPSNDMSFPTGASESDAGGGLVSDWRRALIAFFWAIIVLSCVLSIVSFLVWRHDRNEIRGIVAPEIGDPVTTTETMYQARDFIRDRVGYGRHDSHFLLPVFSFMRPTALQVIREGGDCAYRTRAFIVILDLYDVRARKLALYDRDGRPVHAVAEVPTESGTYYVDLLYNIVHEDDAGEPLSLAELSQDSVLRGSIERAAARGNRAAAAYPLELYDFKDIRTLNWEKNALTKISYRILVAALGEESAKMVPRPYLSEEPALMVITLSLGNTVLILVFILALRRGTRSHRRAAESIATRSQTAAQL